MDNQTLIETLKLEQLEVNLFRGTTADNSPGRIFGGQVIAQSLLAAYATVEGRLCHSLHCYFIRPGDPTIPIIFDVDRSRDGGSFTTRRVVAIQHGQQIFNFSASFMAQEAGLEHQAPMPAAPSWETLEDDAAAERAHLLATGNPPPGALEWLDQQRPIEMRSVGGGNFRNAEGPREPHAQTWFRAIDPIGPDQPMQQVVCAYASDMTLMGTALRPHGVTWRTKGFQAASLDHAMWFHRPINFNNWHLYDSVGMSASGGRGLVRGEIYAADGALVASTAQEGLMRMRAPK